MCNLIFSNHNLLFLIYSSVNKIANKTQSLLSQNKRNLTNWAQMTESPNCLRPNSSLQKGGRSIYTLFINLTIFMVKTGKQTSVWITWLRTICKIPRIWCKYSTCYNFPRYIHTPPKIMAFNTNSCETRTIITFPSH